MQAGQGPPVTRDGSTRTLLADATSFEAHVGRDLNLGVNARVYMDVPRPVKEVRRESPGCGRVEAVSKRSDNMSHRRAFCFFSMSGPDRTFIIPDRMIFRANSFKSKRVQ